MSEFGGGLSEVKNTEVNNLETKDTLVAETGGNASEATRDATNEQANEAGGFDDETISPFESTDAEESREIDSIKEFLSNHGADMVKLGFAFYKLIKALQGDPQSPDSLEISGEMLKVAWIQIKVWWETRKIENSIDRPEIDPMHDIVDVDAVARNTYQISDALTDETEIGFGDYAVIFSEPNDTSDD